MRRWVVAVCAIAACGDTDGDALPRPEANVVFATSTVHSAGFGGLAGGDAICAERAAEAGLDGTFVAWLSTADTSAISRISGRGWVLRDGTPVADRSDDLVTLSLMGPIARDEYGRDIRATQPEVWTATRPDGTWTNTDCLGWTSSGPPPERGDIGNAAEAGGQFTTSGSIACYSPRRLYCFETSRIVPVSIVPRSGRRAFVSASAVVPSPAGRAIVDQQCQAEALAAELPGTYRALLSQDSVAAGSYFDLAGEPWVRTDGALLAPTALELFTGTYLLAPLDRTADGTRAGDVRTWGGDPLVPTSSMNTCSNFTVSDTTFTDTGRPSSSRREHLFTAAGGPCNATSFRVICLQE